MKKVNEKELRYNEDDDRSLFEDILGFIKVFLVTGVVFLLFVNFVAHPVNVMGRSMDPTLQDGEYGFTNVMTLLFNEVERGDIVVVTMDEDGQKTHWVKRIIGLPGETVECIDDQVVIDGEVLDESAYIDETYKKSVVEQYGYFNGVTRDYYDEEKGKNVVEHRGFDKITLGEDEYFVMGDNRIVSKDSRDPSVGPVKKEQLFGKGIIVLFPFNKIGVH